MTTGVHHYSNCISFNIKAILCLTMKNILETLTCKYFADFKTLGGSLPLRWRTCNFNTRDNERKAIKATHTIFVCRTKTATEAGKKNHTYH
jgi:hypothetical protein